MEIEFSKHSLEQMERRRISKGLVLSIINHPDSIVDQDETVRIYSKLVHEESKLYFYRIFVNYLKDPAFVITAYKTSKVGKYGYKI